MIRKEFTINFGMPKRSIMLKREKEEMILKVAITKTSKIASLSRFVTGYLLVYRQSNQSWQCRDSLHIWSYINKLN